MKDIYIDNRVYAMEPKSGIEYDPEFIDSPLSIRLFNPICRIMVAELDLGECETPEYDTVRFFVDTKCGCDHEISPGDAFLMPDGSIYMVVRTEDVAKSRRSRVIGTQTLTDFPGDDSLCLMQYNCPDRMVMKWASKCYPKIIHNTP